MVRMINNALLKNRKILESLLPAADESVKVHREKLLGLGFQFSYFTQQYITRPGKTCYYCYDHGYLPIEHDWYLVVRKKDE